MLLNLWRSEEGASMAEYGLLLLFVALAAVTAFQAVGESVNGLFSFVMEEWP